VETKQLPLTTIDKLVAELKLERVDFIKNGYRRRGAACAAGGRGTLEKHHPRMALSAYHVPSDPERLPALVRAAVGRLSDGLRSLRRSETVMLRPDVFVFPLAIVGFRVDVEKTLQAIVESQLRAERRAAEFDERLKKSSAEFDERHKKSMARMDRADERADRADQRMDRSTRNSPPSPTLVRAGMKMGAGIQREQREMREGLREIRELHKELDVKFDALLGFSDAYRRGDAEDRRKKFNRWLESLRRKNGNGHR